MHSSATNQPLVQSIAMEEETAIDSDETVMNSEPFEQSIAVAETETMNSNEPCLPQELIREILKRLPVKYLIQFQLVCKHWRNLFKTPSFIQQQLNHSSQQNPCLLFQRFQNQGDAILINRDLQVIDFHIPSPVRTCSIVGCCNGLLCFGVKSVHLCNPATREVLHVPNIPNVNTPETSRLVFGFNSIVRDYRIVRISGFGIDGRYRIHVFSLRAMSWRLVGAEILNGITKLSDGFHFDGAIFWIGSRFTFNPEKKGQDLLVSFDLATDNFSLIPFPTSFQFSSFSRFTTYHNKMAMLSHSDSKDPSSHFHVWVVEKCRVAWIWTKMFTDIPTPRSLCVSSLLTLWRGQLFWQWDPFCAFLEEKLPYLHDGGFTFLGDDDYEEEVLLSNLIDGKCKMLRIGGKCSVSQRGWSYEESLLSLANFHM